MAAGLGFKTFTTGEVLTAADTNGYLMQGVLVFASSAARAAAITSPQEGQYSYLKDTNSTEYYDGAAWIAAPIGDITGVTAGTGISGGGTSGTVTITNSMATEITAKGDLIAGTGSATFDNLPVGTNGQTLVADSSTATGLKWAAASSGALTLISTTAFSAVTSQSFNNVFSATYTNYTIYLSMYSSSTAVVAMRFRASGTDNTSSNYYDVMRATASSTGTATSDDNRSASNLIVLGSNQSTSSTVQSQQVLQMMSPFTTTTNKSMTLAYTKGDGSFGGEGWGVLAVSGTAFDGFTIYSTAGGASTITGTASIYGWSK